MIADFIRQDRLNPKLSRARVAAVPFSVVRRVSARFLSVLIEIVLSSILGLLPTHALTEEVWSGRSFYFEKPDSSDWTLEANQDRITDHVWITRKNTLGIFNIAQENGYQSFHSPQQTEWATGNAADWRSLTFQTWQAWAESDPPGTLGIDAVVHLIREDIYIDIRFERWTCCDRGGGVGYYRATRPETPVRASSWGRIKRPYE
jgi:hypothetical protein